MATMITREGLNALEAELEWLDTKERKRIAGWIKEAREGGIVENTDYDQAMEAFHDLESSIEKLKEKLSDIEVAEIDEENETVQIGDSLTVFDEIFGEDINIKIVGTYEANSLEGKVSNESPVGRALLGKHVGDSIKTNVGGNVLWYSIVSIG